jgi:hypothetical protein
MMGEPGEGAPGERAVARTGEEPVARPPEEQAARAREDRQLVVRALEGVQVAPAREGQAVPPEAEVQRVGEPGQARADRPVVPEREAPGPGLVTAGPVGATTSRADAA